VLLGQADSTIIKGHLPFPRRRPMPSLLRHGAVKSEFLAVKEKIGNAEEIGMLLNNRSRA